MFLRLFSLHRCLEVPLGWSLCYLLACICCPSHKSALSLSLSRTSCAPLTVISFLLFPYREMLFMIAKLHDIIRQRDGNVACGRRAFLRLKYPFLGPLVPVLFNMRPVFLCIVHSCFISKLTHRP